MSPEEIEKLKQEVAQKDKEAEELRKSVNALTEEIKEVRKTRKEDREALDALLKDGKDLTPKDPEEVINKAFEKKEAEALKKAQERALTKFKISKSEFNPANDQGGIKFAAFEKELRKFNTSDIKDVEEFEDRLKEVYEFMNRRKRDDDSTNFYDGDSSNSGGANPPKESSVTTELSKKELELIKSNGWTRERYLKLKTKQPAYVNRLLELFR